MSEQISIKELTTGNCDWVFDLIDKHWGSLEIARQGKLTSVDGLPGFYAEVGNKKVGLLTYSIQDNLCEIVTLNSLKQGIGVGTSLVKNLANKAIQLGCHKIVVFTTNDNVGGINFYQNRHFVISKIYKNGVRKSRLVKPSIPLIGDNGIKIEDEIMLTLDLKNNHL